MRAAIISTGKIWVAVRVVDLTGDGENVCVEFGLEVRISVIIRQTVQQGQVRVVNGQSLLSLET